MSAPGALEQRLLILAPRGRDADVIADVLAREQFGCAVVDGLDALLAGVGDGAAAAIVAEEALDGPGMDRIIAYLQAQAPWSDFPLVLLVSRPIGPPGPGVRTRLSELGNVILLERPHRRCATAAASTMRATCWSSASAPPRTCAVAGKSWSSSTKPWKCASTSAPVRWPRPTTA